MPHRYLLSKWQRCNYSRVGEITNRDNLISIEYEYKNGFDAVFWLMSEVKNPIESIGKIEKINLKEEEWCLTILVILQLILE